METSIHNIDNSGSYKIKDKNPNFDSKINGETPINNNKDKDTKDTNTYLTKLCSEIDSLKIMPKVGFTFDERMLCHKVFQGSHPERPERAIVIYANLLLKNISDKLIYIPCEEISSAEIVKIHSEKHLSELNSIIYEENYRNSRNSINEKDEKIERKKNEHIFFFGGDTYDNYYTLESLKLSAGGLLNLCKSALKNEIDYGFAIIRPPGHHSNQNCARGFCFLNNVALTANYLIENKKKVAIVDWDVHHGDGSQEIFYDKSNPLVISLHRHDNGNFYPYGKGHFTDDGEAAGKGYNINIPWHCQFPYQYVDSYIGDDEYYYAFENVVIPVLKEYKPDYILVSCGFDAAENDPLGGLALSPLGYSYMTHALIKVCPKILVALEGGYNLDSLSRCSEAIIRTLLGEKIPYDSLLINSNKDIKFIPPSIPVSELNSKNYFSPCLHEVFTVNQVISHFSQFWKNLKSENKLKDKKFIRIDDKVSSTSFLQVSPEFKKYLIDPSDSEILKIIKGEKLIDIIKIKIGGQTIFDNGKIFKGKISKHKNVNRRTTSQLLEFRIEGLSLRDSSNFLNWNGKEGIYYLINKDDIDYLFTNLIKLKFKNNLVNSLKDFLKVYEKALLKTNFDLFNVDMLIFFKNENFAKSSWFDKNYNFSIKLNGFRNYSFQKFSNTNKNTSSNSNSNSNFLNGIKKLIKYFSDLVIIDN
jgi:acetoin utilization deacetylase AcuC-like enzyme